MGLLTAHRHHKWSLAILIARLVTSPSFFVRGDTEAFLNEAILTDLLHEYNTHEASTCSPSTADDTTFTFTYPGQNSESSWDPESAAFESSLFQAMMSHTDASGNKSWDIRIGTSGNMYSHFARDLHGETMPPQSYEFGKAWVDEVSQMVSVNNNLNQNPAYSQYCPDEANDCAPYFIHQAGAYQNDAPYTNQVVYSPSLAKHCSGNSCMFASWGTQAHVPTPFTSPVIYITKFTNCGNGVIEHTQMIHNFANPLSQVASNLVDQTYFNVGWGGVRSSNLPYSLEPTNDILSYDDVNNVDYLPLCGWGSDPEGRQSIANINGLGGYTTFVGEGLIVNRTAPELQLWCRKPSGCSGAESTCMVSKCTDNQIANGYTRIPLGVSASNGPGCRFHNTANPYADYVPLICNFRLSTGFGQTRPYTSNPDACAPWKTSRIGFHNTATGATLEVSYVRHWSWKTGNKEVFFSVFTKDTSGAARTEAVNMVNSMFATNGADIPITLKTVYLSSVKPSCSIPAGCTAETAATCMVPSCDDDMISNGYTRIELGVPPGGSDCAFDDNGNPYQGLVALQCNLRSSMGFGQADANEETPLGFYNTVNGQTLEVAYVKQWSLNVDDHRVYFSVNMPDDGPTGVNRQAAIDMVNAKFANSGSTTHPIGLRSLTETTGSVPPSYDPATLPTFSYVYGKGEDYSNIPGYGRRRVGSTVDTRDFTVFTINWLGGARLSAGDTYQNRGFMFASDLGTVQATATDLTPKVYIDKIALEDWSPRTIDIYQENQNFAVVASSSAQGTSTTCGTKTMVCSGKSTPEAGYVPFFNVNCGASNYFGPDPYHFSPDFGSQFPAHAEVLTPKYCVQVITWTWRYADGNVEVLVNSGGGYVSQVNGYFGKNTMVLDECYHDLLGVQVRGPTSNAWSGRVLVSTDGKATWSPLTCADCTGTTSSWIMWIDGDASAIADTQCLGGNTCTLPYRRPYCIKATTGGGAFNDGNVQILVDSGSGYSSEVNGFFAKNSIVLDDCYPDLLGIQVRGPNSNAWAGSVLVSMDDKMSYTSLTCTDCTGPTSSSDILWVDGDAAAIDHTQCLGGGTCTLTPPPLVCIKATTGGGTHNDGNVEILINSNNGKGYVQYSTPGKLFAKDEVVVDLCFAEVLGVQVRAPTSNAWSGSVMISMDSKATYSPLTCIDCTGGTSSDIMWIDGDAGAISDTQCLGGGTCTLQVRSVCLYAQTYGDRYAAGSVEILVDSGNGYVSAVNGHFSKNMLVLDECYPDVLGIQIRGPWTNAWHGKILASVDNKLTYSPLACADCTGTSTTNDVWVDLDPQAISGTQCLAGNTCTIPLHPAHVIQAQPSLPMVRSYACDGQHSSVRPSMKLMGFFDPAQCPTSLETATYDPSMCNLFT